MDWRFLFFSFSGRINRAKFWLAVLVLHAAILLTALIVGFATLLGSFLNFFPSPQTLSSAVLTLAAVAGFIALIISSLAVVVKRLHDRDYSGWALVAFYVVPSILESATNFSESFILVLHTLASLIGLWLFVELGVLRGVKGPNEYGSDPLQPTDAAITPSSAS